MSFSVIVSFGIRCQQAAPCPMFQMVRKTVEFPVADGIVDVPVTKQRNVPMLQMVPKTADVPGFVFSDSVVSAPVTPRSAKCRRSVAVQHQVSPSGHCFNFLVRAFDARFTFRGPA